MQHTGTDTLLVQHADADNDSILGNISDSN